MWTSPSSNHTSEHHSPLPRQPDVVVAATPGLPGPHTEDPAAAALDVDRQVPQTPFLDRASGANGAGAAGQGFAFDPALIGPHPPAASRVLRNEVDVGALGRERRIEPQRPAALQQRYVVDVVDQDDEVWYADPAECRLAFAGDEAEPWYGGGRVDGREMQLCPAGLGGATPVSPGLGTPDGVDGETEAGPYRSRAAEAGRAEGGIAAHGGVR